MLVGRLYSRVGHGDWNRKLAYLVLWLECELFWCKKMQNGLISDLCFEVGTLGRAAN
ncbi:hypothetical protein Hdeb2414_s0016g00480351 [Helianthus debilis subsp. tardiflorus]